MDFPRNVFIVSRPSLGPASTPPAPGLPARSLAQLSAHGSQQKTGWSVPSAGTRLAPLCRAEQKNSGPSPNGPSRMVPIDVALSRIRGASPTTPRLPGLPLAPAPIFNFPEDDAEAGDELRSKATTGGGGFRSVSGGQQEERGNGSATASAAPPTVPVGQLRGEEAWSSSSRGRVGGGGVDNRRSTEWGTPGGGTATLAPPAVSVPAHTSASAAASGWSTRKAQQLPGLGLPRTPLLNTDAGTASLRVLPSDESFKWAKDKYNTTERTVDVWSFVLTLRARLFLLDAKWTYLGGFSEAKQKQRRRRLAAWVRESILQLGPTFIKLGQLSSARSDLLPMEFVEELSKLQDKVPAFTAEKSIALIERELGQPLDSLFLEFERMPIAAASLGQVHRAVLFSGEMVVVKVQRPGLKELFDIDLGNMKILAEYFQSSETLGGPSRDWVGIYEECATILYQEIDYINEGRNADRFRRDFRKYPWVQVPQVYWDYTSRKVLTLQYMPGLKVSDTLALDAAGCTREIVARRAIEAYLIQILRTGFFHADPHPGNLAVGPGNSLIYYDFGMMGEIAGFTKDRLLFMFYAVYEKDAKKVVAALIELGALVPTGDLSSVRRSIQFFLDNLTGPKMERETTISAIGEDLFSIAVDQPFRFPATFTFVLRAFTTLEGIGTTLDPNFSFAKVAAPYAQELLDIRDSQRSQDYVVQQLTKQATEATGAAVSMPSRVLRMDDFLQQVESGDIKLRVRVLEAERSARRSGILQIATLNAVGAATFLNVGISLSSGGIHGPATACFAASAVFAAFIWWGMKRVQRLDKFEKML